MLKFGVMELTKNRPPFSIIRRKKVTPFQPPDWEEAENIQVYFNPYQDIEWNNVDHYITAFHTHPYKNDGERSDLRNPHELIDFYAELEHNYIDALKTYGIAGNPGRNQEEEWEGDTYRVDKPFQSWPWTELEDIHDPEIEEENDAIENRDPEVLEVIAYPSVEYLGDHGSEHVIILFGEDIPQDKSTYRQKQDFYEPYTGWEGGVDLADEYGGLAIIAHPNRDDYSPDTYFQKIEEKDAFIGFEVINKTSDREDVERWDSILSHFSPSIEGIYGVGAQDQNDNWDIGGDSFTRNTSLILNPNDLDHTNQTQSRQKVREAWENGNLFAHRRPAWNNPHEPPAPYPKINSIEINEQEKKIAIDTKDTDKIEWFSEGKKVAEGEEFNFGFEELKEKFVRFELKNDAGGETFSQPISFTEE